MADVWLGRFSRWVEKLFNAKGGPVLFDVDSGVRVVATLDKGVDQRYLEGWNRFGVQTTVNALAANFGRVRIRNPVGSNVIVVLEQLQTTLTAGGPDSPFVTWGATVTDLANITSTAFSRIDPRGNPQPTAIVSGNSQAAGGTPFLQRGALVNTNNDWINTVDQEIPILPGQVVDIQSNTANTQLICSMIWRERALENSELA